MCLRRFRVMGLSVARYQWRVSNDSASVFTRDDAHLLALTKVGGHHRVEALRR
jgi:hypothetical protein